MPIPSSELDRDRRLAKLLVEFTDRQSSSSQLDLAEVARQNPDLADELQELLPFIQLADNAAFHSENSAPTLPHRGDGGAPAAPLPRRFAHFELREEIGRGGMGVVYKAWDERLGRHVALKMVLRGENASDQDLQRFRAEARAVGGLSHRHIVPIYEVGEHEGRAYFCMQFIEGETLAQVIERGPLPSRLAARCLAAVAAAVHHAHVQGILHRDLKPANILLMGKSAAPMVTDFGLAKRVEGGASLTGTGQMVGTPNYMAPEQASGQGKSSPASDVYSLGATLYAALTGRPPFQAASVVDVLLQVRSEEPVRPRLLNPSIDSDLEFICLKCLEKRPEHRYRSAQALAEDLHRYLNSEPVQARSSNLLYFIGRIFRETHHAPVMENWGRLWMWHALMVFLLCAVTNAMFLAGVHRRDVYILLWGVGLVAWAIFFWNWRRRAGPVMFVEQQIAHAWAGGVIVCIGAFVVEMLTGAPVLKLSPILAIGAGMVFLFKAGTLSGWFYVASAACILTAIPMALWPDVGLLLFGAVSGLSFFIPGLRYYRRKQKVDTTKRKDADWQ